MNLFSLGFANCTDVFPVYIGDDRTDEDAFKVSNAQKSKPSQAKASILFIE